MADLVVTACVTVDGVYQGPGDPDEDRGGGFGCGGWAAPYLEGTVHAFVARVLAGATAFLLGRRTYEIFARCLPRVTGPVAARLNRLPKYVASGSGLTPYWAHSRVLHDVPGEVAGLKRRLGGELHVPGSGDLVQTLMEYDLVDAYNLLVFPVVLGTGKRLFPHPGAAPAGLRLTSARTTRGGVFIGCYARAGAPVFGTMQP